MHVSRILHVIHSVRRVLFLVPLIIAAVVLAWAQRSPARESPARDQREPGYELKLMFPREIAPARSRTAGDRRLAAAAVDLLEFDVTGAVAIDRAGFARLGRELAGRLLSRVIQAIGPRMEA